LRSFANGGQQDWYWENTFVVISAFRLSQLLLNALTSERQMKLVTNSSPKLGILATNRENLSHGK